MNIQKMLQSAQQLQKKMNEFEKKEFEYNYKNYINVKIGGNLKIHGIKIDQSLVENDDIEMLEDIIILAINEAHNFVENEREKFQSSFNKVMPKGFF